MQTATTTMTIRLDKTVKSQAQSIYSELGIDMTTAINVFLRQSIRSKGFPFEVNLRSPNKETLLAMHDVQEGKNLVGPFSSVDELTKSLEKND